MLIIKERPAWLNICVLIKPGMTPLVQAATFMKEQFEKRLKDFHPHGKKQPPVKPTLINQVSIGGLSSFTIIILKCCKGGRLALKITR